MIEERCGPLDNMRVFAKLVESSSFAAAATRLGISASMVTLHVKELEELLGVRLLNRTTLKVSLPETGHAYYERCTRPLADLEETEQAVSDMHAAHRHRAGSCASMPRRLSAYCSWRPPLPKRGRL